MALSDNMRGAGLMVIAMAAFTFNDAAMKSLAGNPAVSGRSSCEAR